MVTEMKLLERWCAGSEQAGDQLLRRCVPMLQRFFANKVGDATDDLVQQTLVSCVRNRDKMLQSGVFDLYLYKIARCRLYDHIRAARRHEGQSEPDFEHDSVISPGRSFGSIIGYGRAAEAVRQALRWTPIDMQMVVELHYWEDRSTAEIAAILDIAQGTVKSRLRRAREALGLLLRSAPDEVHELIGRARPAVGEPCSAVA